MSWSSGKDSAFALHAIHEQGVLDVIGLLTTVNADADRVAMHAVLRTLLEAQADRLGLPLHVVSLPSPCPNDVYEERMAEAMAAAAASRVEHVIFGDLFLADVRAYREKALAGSGITPLFPLWGRPTGTLAREVIAAGVRAVLTCVDPAQLDPRYVGRDFDARPGRLPRGRRPVRGARRVPHLRVGCAGVPGTDRRRGGRSRPA